MHYHDTGRHVCPQCTHIYLLRRSTNTPRSLPNRHVKIMLVYIAIILLGLYLFLKWERKKGKTIPGPTGWPFIGVGLEVTQRNIFNKFSSYAKQYGDIFQIQMFGNNIVVLNSVDLIRKAFTAEPYKKVMNDRRGMFVGKEFYFDSADLALMEHSQTPEYNMIRKAFTQGLRHYGEGRKQFEDMVQISLHALVQKLNGIGETAFVFHDVIKRSTQEIISLLISGHHVQSHEDFLALDLFDRSVDFFLNAFSDTVMLHFPFMKYIPSVYKTHYQQLTAAQQRILQVYYHDDKATYTPGQIRGMADFMLSEQSRSHGGQEGMHLTDERIQASLLDVYGAGVSTTVTTLSSIFLCLMNHPEYQAKIQQEIDRVIGRDRPPTFDDKHSCPMIEAVVLETMRYITTIPGLLPHECKTHIEFEGYDIPRNTMIIPNVYGISHDEKLWGDPWTFRPERFLTNDGDIVPNDHIYRMSWLAFGTGRRQCVGESLARSRLFLFIATLLQRWTFEFQPGREVSCDPRSENFEVGGTLRAHPFYCRVVPRA